MAEEGYGEPGASGEEPSLQRLGVKLFLGGLSWETTEEKVKQHFQRYGEIVEAVVMKDRVTGKPRGFGFITFRDESVADRVCQDTHILDGRQIDAKRSVPQEQKPKSKKIFVGGLAPETTEEDFKNYFEQFGRVTEAQIMVDHQSGRSRGFGFITFEEEQAVDRVFNAGTMHELAGKKVEVKEATPKGSGSLGGRGVGRGGRPAIPGRGVGFGPFPGQFPGQLGPPAGYGVGAGYPGALSSAYGPGIMSGYGVGYASAPYGMVLPGYGYPSGYGSYGPPFGQQPGGPPGYEPQPGQPGPSGQSHPGASGRGNFSRQLQRPGS